jgi:hypothetical protein
MDFSPSASTTGLDGNKVVAKRIEEFHLCAIQRREDLLERQELYHVMYSRTRGLESKSREL